MHETDVFIIGGGPVGLSASLLLADQGIRTTLVERNATVSNHPKASAFNTRTMEVLRELGIADDVYATTTPAGGVSFYTSLTGYKLGHIQMNDHPDYIQSLISSTPAPLAISSQIVLEAILKEHADRHPLVDVRFNCRKEKLTQGDEFTEATVVDQESGKEEVIRAKYTIACDGAGSPTRKEFGRELVGPPSFGYQINAYIEADIESLTAEETHQALYWISNNETSGVFIGLGGDWNKWCYNFTYFPDRGEKAEDFTEAECLNRVYAALGTDTLPVKILSIGPWVLCGQVIDEYRDGRVFFGGDAAHLNIPTGGFGFNTGMQEIHNLAWKLGYVLRGLAPDSLLDTYHEERRDIAVYNVETSRKNAINIRETGAGLGGEVMESDEIEIDSERGQAQRKIRSDAIDRQYSHFIFLGQEIGFGYWDSSLVTPDGSLHYSDEHQVENPVSVYIPNARPGARAPHCWVEHDGERLSLLDLFRTDFTLLICGNDSDWLGESQQPDIPLRTYTIGDENSDLKDIDNVFRRYYGIDSDGAVLVRPDGHVAWRANHGLDPHDGVSLSDALAKSIGK